MTADTRIERALPRILDDLGAGPQPDYVDDVLARAAAMRQRPLWSFPERWLPANILPRQAVGGPRVLWRTFGVVALILLALAAGALVVGSGHRALPPPFGPAGNGLIAYDAGGDIYVGDPATGITTAIVAGPGDDSRPVFSPDGSRIVFVRRHRVAVDPGGEAYPVGGWDPVGTSDIVVVRPDGSDLRVITRERLVGLELSGWTPDSAFIVARFLEDIGPEWVGVEKAFDAARTAMPRDLVDMPPHSQRALRPPNGDRVLVVGDGESIAVSDADGTDVAVLVDRSDLDTLIDPTRQDTKVEGRPYVVAAMWSPDWTKIAFVAEVWYESPCGISLIARPHLPCTESWVYVMTADGSEPRRVVRDAGAVVPGVFTTEENALWSPDSSRIVFDRRLTFESGDTLCCTVIVADVGTGAQRELDATAAGYGGPDAADDRSWSPDGRSLLFYDYRRSRLVTVDSETGVATELPWRVGLAPNWQRVAAD